METFRLWLEPDNDIPQFKRLRFEKVTVPLADVLLRGIHPWQGRDTNTSLKERLHLEYLARRVWKGQSVTDVLIVGAAVPTALSRLTKHGITSCHLALLAVALAFIRMAFRPFPF